jgi:hypothetical protein
MVIIYVKGIKNRVVFTSLICILIISSFHLSQVYAGSSEGDPAPPGGGGGGGGGGGPQFFDYFVPLIFDSNNPHGYSEIAIWVIQPLVIITDFLLDPAGITVAQIQEPRKIVLNPIDNPGLTNGSLIRLTSPAQVVGFRGNEDILSDNSFSYSILPARMMGFEFKAPFDGYISVVSRTMGTEINIQNEFDYSSHELGTPIATGTFPVNRGDYINSTQPIIAAFYSYDPEIGMSATMGVPNYLKGNEYLFNSDISQPRESELDYSFIYIDIEEPTELEITFSQSKKIINAYENLELRLDDPIVSIKSLRGDISVTLELIHVYAGLSRRSSVQLMAAPQMRAGEVFILPNGYSSHFSVINPKTNITTIKYTSGEYVETSKLITEKEKYDQLTFSNSDDITVIIANHSLFGFASSPGQAGHPMSTSSSFLLLPLNVQTLYRNVTDLTVTWYRFTNLAVQSIEVIPDYIEEMTGVTVRVTFISNGSLPAGNFKARVIIDGEIEFDQSFNFLQVGETIVFELRYFLNFNKNELRISADIDYESSVIELNDDDNSYSTTYEVNNNIRLRTTAIILIVFTIGFISYKLIDRWRKMVRSMNSKFDAILEIEEIVEDE